MPRILNPLFANEVRKTEQSTLVRLITLPLTSDFSLRLCDANYNIYFGGNEYSAFPFKIGGVSTQTDGTVDQTTLTCANVERLLLNYLEKYDGLRGIKVHIITTYTRFLDNIYTRDPDTGELTITTNTAANSAACIEDVFIIDSYTATEQVITFLLDPLLDAGISIPKRRFTPTTCYWRFKDSSCGYTTTDLTVVCDKSLNNCKALGNSKRFGGFPGIPDRVQRIWL